MRQKTNPSYNAELNANNEAITIVRHVPALPPASGIYKNDLLYCKSDCCFYHEIEAEGNYWIWERVTYGINRQYVVPVPLLFGTAYDFNDIVKRLSKILKWLHDRYDEAFEPFRPSNEDLGVTEEECIAKYNELAVYLNHVCHAALPIFPEDHLADGTEMHYFAETYVNAMIRFLNPYADNMTLIDSLCTIDTSKSAAEILGMIKSAAETIRVLHEEI